MSIIEAYDESITALTEPTAIIQKVENFPETVIVVWAQKFAQQLSEMFDLQQITVLSAGLLVPIYRFTYREKTFAFYHSPIGGAPSSGLLEEIIAMGGKNILFFGSCGALDQETVSGNLIVPTAAYRDEGTSYHYAPVSDFISIQSATHLAEIFNELHVAYVKGKIWTTDGFYRETAKNVAARKKDGCIAVDMECASVMACGQFRNVNVYEFVYAADCLDKNTWDLRILGCMPHNMQERILRIALETAVRL